MITMLLQDSLADLGCEVVGTSSRYSDALVKAASLSFDVAILDVNLKGQHTFPIAGVLAERGLAFVFSTGYSAANLPATLPRVPILQKPFHLADLQCALRAALAGKT